MRTRLTRERRPGSGRGEQTERSFPIPQLTVTGRFSVTKFVRVARADEIRAGAKKIVDVDGLPIVVANLDGRFYALEDVCTHDGGALGEGELWEGQIICPRHGARFDVRTGAALTLPAFEPVPTYPVQVEDGDILVEAY
jgi:3-phenylpropionate/trans-cinnamate dioxygenase ferredoxin component